MDRPVLVSPGWGLTTDPAAPRSQRPNWWLDHHELTPLSAERETA